MEIITKNAKETFDLGKKIGSSLVGGETLAFSGDLGAGKTTFIQGLAAGIGIKNKIVSPTFILMRKYETKKRSFYHLDLYRLEENIEKEIQNLGLFDIWKDGGDIVAVEWAEKYDGKWPENTTWIKFENVGEDERRIVVQ